MSYSLQAGEQAQREPRRILALAALPGSSQVVTQPFLSRIFLRELEKYTDCPELVGRCFLERVSTSLT